MSALYASFRKRVHERARSHERIQKFLAEPTGDHLLDLLRGAIRAENDLVQAIEKPLKKVLAKLDAGVEADEEFNRLVERWSASQARCAAYVEAYERELNRIKRARLAKKRRASR